MSRSFSSSSSASFADFFLEITTTATAATTATGQLNPFAFKLSNVIPDKDAEGNLINEGEPALRIVTKVTANREFK